MGSTPTSWLESIGTPKFPRVSIDSSLPLCSSLAPPFSSPIFSLPVPSLPPIFFFPSSPCFSLWRGIVRLLHSPVAVESYSQFLQDNARSRSPHAFCWGWQREL